MTTDAYRQGAAARLSDQAEPDCPYTPGTPEYSDFADGFCEAAVLQVPAYMTTGEESHVEDIG